MAVERWRSGNTDTKRSTDQRILAATSAAGWALSCAFAAVTITSNRMEKRQRIEAGAVRTVGRARCKERQRARRGVASCVEHDAKDECYPLARHIRNGLFLRRPGLAAPPAASVRMEQP